MSSIIDVDGPNSWRQSLLRASFRGFEFHVESGGVSGGRRVVAHEFPKRNTPYSEDMGRRVQRWPIQGYIIVSPDEPDYIPARDDLLNALESDGPGILVHPTIRQGNPTLVMVDAYTMTETREKGGYVLFEMSFVERGNPINQDVIQSTSYNAVNTAQAAGQYGASSLDANLLGTNVTISDPSAFITMQQQQAGTT